MEERILAWSDADTRWWRDTTPEEKIPISLARFGEVGLARRPRRRADDGGAFWPRSEAESDGIEWGTSGRLIGDHRRRDGLVNSFGERGVHVADRAGRRDE